MQKTYSKDEQFESLSALLDTVDFTRGLIGELLESGVIGKTSKAGQFVEANSRLSAAADLVKKRVPQFVEMETKSKVLKALGLGLECWHPGSMSAYAALCFVRLPEVGTIADALTIAERMDPITAASTNQYKATFKPLDFMSDKDSNDVFDTTPYFAKLFLFGGKDTFHLNFYVIREGIEQPVRVEIPVKNFAPIERRIVTDRVDSYGRAVSHKCELQGERSFFRDYRRMWASKPTENDYIMWA